MNNSSIEQLIFYITLKCPLNCKHCLALVPYTQKKYAPTFEALVKEVNAFFKLAHTVNVVQISGGEPFSRGAGSDTLLADIIRYICGAYADRFKFLRIVTAGTVIPSDYVCEDLQLSAAKKPIQVLIDNYAVSTKTNELINKLEHYGIEYIARDYTDNIYLEGWVDLLDTSLKVSADTTPEERFYACANKNNYQGLTNGILTACCVARARYMSGEIDTDDMDIIDVFSEDHEAINQKFLKMIDKSIPFGSCAYCDGFEKARRVMPAEQATNEEISEWRANHEMRF